MSRVRVSFEFFPPKTAEMEQSLWECVGRLAPLKPNFVSVTYGAGGSTRERTHSTVKRILAETALTPPADLMRSVGEYPLRQQDDESRFHGGASTPWLGAFCIGRPGLCLGIQLAPSIEPSRRG